MYRTCIIILPFLRFVFSFLPSIQVTNEFPANEVFNSSQSLPSNYLCTKWEEKCCHCKIAKCLDDCCLDAYWDESSTESLDEYLKRIVKIKANNELGGRCLSVFPYEKTHHVLEHVRMVSTYNDSTGRLVECPNDMPFSEKMIFFSPLTQKVYINSFCATLNNDKGIPVNLTVNCKDDENFSDGDVFDPKPSQNMSNCVFRILGNRMDFTFCSNEKDYCEKGNEYYDLCKSYYAPFKGYKNPHCFLCHNPIEELQFDEPSEECIAHWYGKDKNDIRRHINMLDSKITFDLIVDENMLYIVRNKKHPFITKEFLNSSNISPELSEALHPRLCAGLTNRDEVKCCDCDVSCFKFQTCCMDILWDGKKLFNAEEYRDLLIQKSKEYKIHKCLHVVRKRGMGNSYYMIASCLRGTTKAFLKRCISDQPSKDGSHHSVIGSDGYLYRNKWCAQCNNITEYLVMSEHDLRVFSNRSIVRNCTPFQNTDDNCRLGNTFYDLCHSHTSEISGFKNLFCFLCSSEPMNETTLKVSRQCSSIVSKESWSRLISFQFLLKRRIVQQCRTGEVYSTIMNSCVESQCDLETAANAESCTKQGSKNDSITKRFLTFDDCIGRKQQDLYVQTFNSTKIPDLSLLLPTLLNRTTQPPLLFTYGHSRVYQLKMQSVIPFRFFQKNLKYFTTDRNISIYIGISSKPYLDRYHGFSFHNSFPGDRLCRKTTRLDTNQVKFTLNCDMIYKSRTFVLSNVSMWLMWNGNIFHRYLTVCDEFYLKPNCTLSTFSKNGLVLHDNGSVTSKERKTYRAKDYIPTRNGVALCTETTAASHGIDKWLLSLKRYEDYASLAGSSVSLFAYIAVIVLFYANDNIKNVSGKCTVSLTSCLFVGDSFYIIAVALYISSQNSIYELCKSIAIIIHGSLIMAQAWCFVYSLDILITFSSARSMVLMNRSKHRFFIYFGAVILYTLILVSVGAILDSTETVHNHYGTKEICLPYGSRGHLFFYIIPSIASYVFSLLFLIIAIVKISRQKKRSKEALRNSQRHHMSISTLALKLILVLGVSEGIGFIQILHGSDDGRKATGILSFIYTIVRSLRGFLLALVYVCRHDFQMLLKERIHQPKRGKIEVVSSNRQENSNSRKETSFAE